MCVCVAGRGEVPVNLPASRNMYIFPYVFFSHIYQEDKGKSEMQFKVKLKIQKKSIYTVYTIYIVNLITSNEITYSFFVP